MRANPREMTNVLLEVRQFGCSRFQNATAKDVVMTFSDTMTPDVHSGNGKLYLAPDYERFSRPSASTRSVGHWIKRFCAGINILIYNS
jgi:hypothetical protein